VGEGTADVTPAPRRERGAPRTRPDKRGQGQWALGYHEPLNPAERTKRDDDGLNVRARIETIYAKNGFRSIDKADLRSRFRWWGLYTQRRNGVPAGATASAEPEELEDEFFMLRIRIAGGLLTSEQLRAIAYVSERFGRDVADVTDRQNIQLHWIRIEDMPRIFEAIERVGLTTAEACGDTPRNMIGCPLAGIDASTEPSSTRASSTSWRDTDGRSHLTVAWTRNITAAIERTAMAPRRRFLFRRTSGSIGRSMAAP